MYAGLPHTASNPELKKKAEILKGVLNYIFEIVNKCEKEGKYALAEPFDCPLGKHVCKIGIISRKRINFWKKREKRE